METQTKTLAAIVKDHNALVELIIESEGEVNPTLEEWLKVDEKTIQSKVDGYKFAIDDLSARAEFLKARAKIFTNAAKRLENVVSSIESNLKFQMTAMNADEVRGSEFRFMLTQPKNTVVIEDNELVPATFTDETIVFTPNKDRILAALESGEQVNGCKIQQSRQLRSYAITTAKPKKIKGGE